MTALTPGQQVRVTIDGTVDTSPEGGWWTFKDAAGSQYLLAEKADHITVVSVPEPAPAPAGDAAAELEALAEAFYRESDGTGEIHEKLSFGRAAKACRARAAELRAAAPAPAEWGTITAADVQVGDHIEVTRRKGSGAIIVYTGTVSSYDGPRRVFLAEDLCIDIHLPDQTIRRRVRQQMREPEAPAVVRHAGLIWARRIDSVQWFGLDNHDGGRLWREVLALDPATDPVVVDLGGGE